MIGTTLANYRILEQIGQGGMARVYKAYDPMMDRHVAIKVLPEMQAENERALERFRREARAVAKLEHFHILPVYAFGEEAHTVYLVMRYMAAGTLADRIARGSLPLTEVARVIGQIASALDYAHKNEVLHRDVKPSNVLLDDEGNAFLTDFGVAKMMEATVDLTKTGGVLGTPAYMAPEQCMDAGEITPAADQYSLGVVLYEMLTGRTPYQAETPFALIRMHFTQEPISLPRSLRPDLSEAAERAILKALARDAEARHGSCVALAQAFADGLINKEEEADAPAAAVPLGQGESAFTRDETVLAEAPVVRAPLPLDLEGPTIDAEDLSVGQVRAIPRVLSPGIPVVKRNADWQPMIREINGVLMALVPPGRFLMGSEEGHPDERPVHEVIFESPFWIDVHPVTNAQFERFGGEAIRRSDWPHPDCPRVSIRWDEAAGFCERRGVRLPTEAEWEYAARGPDGLRYPWGDDFIAANVIYGLNSDNRLWPVGGRPEGSSWVEAQDMSGLVWEWVADRYGKYCVGDQSKKWSSNPLYYRGLRGGSWNVSSVNILRSSYRGRNNSDNWGYSYGLRCILPFTGL